MKQMSFKAILLGLVLGLLAAGCENPNDGAQEVRVRRESSRSMDRVSQEVAAPGPADSGTGEDPVIAPTTPTGVTGIDVETPPPSEPDVIDEVGHDTAPTLPPPPVVPACTPVSAEIACADQDCGTVDDGCGATFECGTCAAPATCDTEHDTIYPTNVCRVTGDPAEQCRPIPGGSGLSRCTLGSDTYCRELFGRVRPCPSEIVPTPPPAEDSRIDMIFDYAEQCRWLSPAECARRDPNFGGYASVAPYRSLCQESRPSGCLRDQNILPTANDRTPLTLDDFMKLESIISGARTVCRETLDREGYEACRRKDVETHPAPYYPWDPDRRLYRQLQAGDHEQWYEFAPRLLGHYEAYCGNDPIACLVRYAPQRPARPEAL
ncbi:MAG TPA: hypothetical protein VLJ37_00820 [bacterium]|nr:hypothetical protein [bacterium]